MKNIATEKEGVGEINEGHSAVGGGMRNGVKSDKQQLYKR